MSQQIFQLIPKVMADVGVIEKDKKNAQQGYSFRGIDDVFAAFQPVLAKHQVFYVPEVLESTTTDRQTKSGSNLIYTNLKVAYTFYAPDGSNVRAVVVGEAMDAADKSSNKAMSAALKYALLQIFCVPTEANEDADAQTYEVAPKVKTTALSGPRGVDSNEAIEASSSGFWRLQRTSAFPKERAVQIVSKHNQDWEKAIAELKDSINKLEEAA